MLESTPVDQRTVDAHVDEPASAFVLGGGRECRMMRRMRRTCSRDKE